MEKTVDQFAAMFLGELCRMTGKVEGKIVNPEDVANNIELPKTEFHPVLEWLENRDLIWYSLVNELQVALTHEGVKRCR